MTTALASRLDRGILWVEMTHPPVNCLSQRMRRELYDTFTLAASDAEVCFIVLCGAGKHFCAGGDLREMGTPAAAAEPRLSADILPAIERCPKPVIAALHGSAIGGGFEMALACHYRVALDTTQIALPEVQHGIIPLSGSIRLPRVWGIENALGMMLASSRKLASEFTGCALFDGMAPCDQTDVDGQRACLRSAVLELVHDLAFAGRSAERHRRNLIRHRPPVDALPLRALSDALAQYDQAGLTPAQRGVIAAVSAGVDISDFDAALRESQHIYDLLMQSLWGEP